MGLLISHLIRPFKCVFIWALFKCYLRVFNIFQLYFLLKSMFVDNIYEHNTNNTFDTFDKLE